MAVISPEKLAEPKPQSLTDPFKLAHLPDIAWRDHARKRSPTGAAAAPFATSVLPPIAAE